MHLLETLFSGRLITPGSTVCICILNHFNSFLLLIHLLIFSQLIGFSIKCKKKVKGTSYHFPKPHNDVF